MKHNGRGVLNCPMCALLLMLAILVLVLATPVQAKIRTCGPFYIRDAGGRPINPLTGENADQPLSTRQTCGACHDYGQITKGYHFQQGWERIRDDFTPAKPWILSDGMMDKQ